MCEVYRLFTTDWEHLLDFSDEAMGEMFVAESHGGIVSQLNGFSHGKKWLNVTVAMWKDDIKNWTLFKEDLYDDKFPHWWLDSVFKSK
jgi:hypothetical protein